MRMLARSHPKYPVHLEVFQRENALSFYLLGVFLTDGNIDRLSGHKNDLYRVGLTSTDEDWLKLIRDLISPTRPIWQRKDQKARRVELTNQDLTQWLISWGCHERKSLTVEFPSGIPDEFLPDCVRGIFDGDGSLTVCHYRKVKNGKNYTYP